MSIQQQIIPLHPNTRAEHQHDLKGTQAFIDVAGYLLVAAEAHPARFYVGECVGIAGFSWHHDDAGAFVDPGAMILGV